MSIEIEPQYPPGVAPFLTISSASGMMCNGTNLPQPITVTIAGDAPAPISIPLFVTGTTSMGSTCQAQASISVSKLVITAQRIDQDEPANSAWSALAELSPLYSGSEASTADNLRLTVVPSGAPIATVEWTYTGPGSGAWSAPPIGPTATTWDLGDILNPMPGEIEFNATITYTDGKKQCGKFKTEIGVRTDDVILIGWIDANNVPWPMPAPGWLTAILPTAFPPAPPALACNNLIRELSENDEIPFSAPAALTAAERDYILFWMFRFGGNLDPRGVRPNGLQVVPGTDFRDPTDSFMDETEFSTYVAGTIDYKLVNRFQVRYGATANGFLGTPTVLKAGTWIGHTENPCGTILTFLDVFPGQRGSIDTGIAAIGSSNRTITLINDGSPDAGAIRAFNTLRGKAVAPFGWTPLFWENIGSAIRFRYDGNTEPSVVLQPYPTYYEYRNGKFVHSTPQAASPLANFATNPYPFGTVSCIRTGGITPGGRCGDAESTPAGTARVPNYTLILP